MKFYLKKGADISKYGFQKQDDKHWFWWRTNKHGNKGLNLIYYEKDRRIVFNSASSDSIAVICEMYKNGDIEIKNDEELINVPLTQEEYDLIMERRNQ